MNNDDRLIVGRDNLQCVIEAIQAKGFEVLGPKISEGSILYEKLTSVDDLPIGWTDRQECGTYRLVNRSDGALFNYVLGQNAWKRFLHLPDRKLWSAEREGNRFSITSEPENTPRYAFFGIRSCEIHAIELMDQALLKGGQVDQGYRARREGVLIVAVNCYQPGGTCFCTSMGTGPRAEKGYDLCLTELLAGQHRFLVEVGSDIGREIVSQVAHEPATQADLDAVDRLMKDAASRMGRKLEVEGVQELLYEVPGHAHWEEIAQRCLCCGNCTLVCPTCFCSTIQDYTDLSGEHAERVRKWDSCFSEEFSYIHGGSVRLSPMSRYRQWMTHKLASWSEQFGSPGCVGCGRCITWCPVGIDITEEAAFFRAEQSKPKGRS